MTQTQTPTLDVVRGVIEEVVGPEWTADRTIGMETSFGNDLELESIEFVALAEKLQTRYEKVDFVRWLSEKELEEIIELKVGDVVTYIDTCR